MAHLDNTFGIEIECYLPAGQTQPAIAGALTDRLAGLGVCHPETYNHLTRSHWKIVTDGSLNDYDRGIEVVAPPQLPATGFDAVTRVAEALTDYGCSVAKSCGLHIHVGVDGRSLSFFKNLAKLYSFFEPVIDRFMPPSRRASASAYAKSITHVSFAAIDRAASVDELIRLVNPDRFFKLNLSAYRRHRTVEFRQHSGTLEASKMLNWAQLCLRMVEAAKTGRGLPVAHAARNNAPVGSKAHLVGQLMLRPEGVTGPEAMAATGWPSISLPQQASICGLTFTTVRTGRVVRYFAQAAAASTDVAPTLEGMFDALGCDEAERSFFRARTRNLSGSVEWAS